MLSRTTVEAFKNASRRILWRRALLLIIWTIDSFENSSYILVNKIVACFLHREWVLISRLTRTHLRFWFHLWSSKRKRWKIIDRLLLMMVGKFELHLYRFKFFFPVIVDQIYVSIVHCAWRMHFWIVFLLGFRVRWSHRLRHHRFILCNFGQLIVSFWSGRSGRLHSSKSFCATVWPGSRIEKGPLHRVLFRVELPQNWRILTRINYRHWQRSQKGSLSCFFPCRGHIGKFAGQHRLFILRTATASIGLIHILSQTVLLHVGLFCLLESFLQNGLNLFVAHLRVVFHPLDTLMMVKTIVYFFFLRSIRGKLRIVILLPRTTMFFKFETARLVL